MDNLFAAPGIVAVSLFFFGLSSADAVTLSPEMPQFQFELQAQRHCPVDAIVWVVAGRRFYNSSSERWYGRTSDGAYACRGDAEKAGYRPSSAAAAVR